MELVWPAQPKIELPLLRAILRRGGSIHFSRDGTSIETELADHFRLSKEHREYSSPEIRAKGNRKWCSILQHVRWKLVDKGDLDGTIHDVWRVTHAGRYLCGEPDKFAQDLRRLQPSLSNDLILLLLRQCETSPEVRTSFEAAISSEQHNSEVSPV